MRGTVDPAHALGRGRLSEPSARLEALRKAAIRRVMAPIGLYAVSMGVAHWQPALSLLVYVLLPLAYLIPSRVDHWAEG